MWGRIKMIIICWRNYFHHCPCKIWEMRSFLGPVWKWAKPCSGEVELLLLPGILCSGLGGLEADCSWKVYRGITCPLHRWHDSPEQAWRNYGSHGHCQGGPGMQASELLSRFKKNCEGGRGSLWGKGTMWASEMNRRDRTDEISMVGVMEPIMCMLTVSSKWHLLQVQVTFASSICPITMSSAPVSKIS